MNCDHAASLIGNSPSTVTGLSPMIGTGMVSRLPLKPPCRPFGAGGDGSLSRSGALACPDSGIRPSEAHPGAGWASAPGYSNPFPG